MRNDLHSARDNTQQSAQIDLADPCRLVGRTLQAMVGGNGSRTVTWSPE